MDKTKLDRLIKLAKLANHNPNDSEANAAARAVAKMLSDNNYKWIDSAMKNGGSPPRSTEPIKEPTIKEWVDPLTGDVTIRITQLDAVSNPKIKQILIALEDEIRKPKTWNDVHRSEEPFWKSTRDYQPRNRYSYWGDDSGRSTGFNWEAEFERAQQARKQQEERRKQAAKEEQRRWQERTKTNWTWDGGRSGDKGYKKVYQQKCRDCSVCGITRLTVDETTPYVCYECKRKG